MKRTLQITTAFFFGTAAFAQSATDAMLADLSSQGYASFEVQSGTAMTKIEAVRGTEKIEVTFDNTTGAVLKREVESIDPATGQVTKTEYKSDMYDDMDDMDDDMEDDDGEDDDGEDDDSNDEGDDDDSGDDNGDDNGGDRDSDEGDDD